MSSRRFRMLAMAAAVAAFVIASIAAIVVIARSGSVVDSASPLQDLRVTAADIAALNQSGATEVGPDGMRVLDADLAKRLGLAANARVTALSGRPLMSAADLRSALVSFSRRITTIYAEETSDQGHTLLRWKIDGDLAALRGRPSSDPFGVPSARVPPTDPARDALFATIEKVDETHYRIPHAAFESILADPMKMAVGMRVVPALRNGHPDGVKLYAIRPSSLVAHFGLNNGDTIETINGISLMDPTKALDAYTRLRDSPTMTIGIERFGVPMILTITVI